MNPEEPTIYATLDNGYRVTATRPPVSKYFTVDIRLFVYKDLSVERRDKFLDGKMLELVTLLIKYGRRNVAIIGDMGCGKTTAADELVIRILDDNIAIGLAENTHELSISENYKNKNVIELQYTKRHKPSEITELFLRLNRDIIIYGEVRSAAEALEMIEASLRQRGSLFTFHSVGTKTLIHNLRRLLMSTDYYTDSRAAQYDVASAIDIIIHIKQDKKTGKRYVFKISESITHDKEMDFEVNDLFVYDREKEKYLVRKKGISTALLDDCMDYELTKKDVEYIKKLFIIDEADKDKFEYQDEEMKEYEQL